MNFPDIYCSVKFFYEGNIIQVGEKISENLIGGLPFVGLEEYIYDEVPAVYIKQPILGLEIVLQGYGGSEGYVLGINLAYCVDAPGDYMKVDISPLIKERLANIDGLVLVD